MFASIGPRTTGTGPGAFGLLGPLWHETDLPPGMTAIASPTSTPRVVGCIEAAGERDEDALRRAYDGFRLTPLTTTPAQALNISDGDRAVVSAVAPATDLLHVVLHADSDDLPLSGEHRYRLRFEPDATPPVHGFWSLSTRAATEMHAIGDLHGLAIDLDGSLPIHIQHAAADARAPVELAAGPGATGSASLSISTGPRPRRSQERWSPPPLERV